MFGYDIVNARCEDFDTHLRLLAALLSPNAILSWYSKVRIHALVQPFKCGAPPLQ